MMDDSKKRFQIGFIGSLGFHLFVFLVLAFAGLFAANHVDDKIVEIAVFGGGGGGRPNMAQAGGKIGRAHV